VQVWLPDTRTTAFAAQVAHDIAAVADLATDDAAMLDAFEGIAAEDLRECG
jgi:ketosteroid isomerase-like protein